MSVVVAEGVVEVTADVGGVPRDIATGLGGADPLLAERGRSSGRAFIGGLAAAAVLAGVVSIGVNIGQAIGEGIRAGFDFTVEGIGLASDLAETRAAIGEVFGGGASDVEAFASRANVALGQTQQQALEGARTFGIFGQAAGLSGGDLATFSTDLVTLASDLASFNNTSPEEAITAIGAALRGEAEPIRAYGVLLDDATLRQRALALGLIETTTQALTPQQRVLAAQAEIYAQTATQQGDFARTSDGLANQQRILAASFEEAQTKLGTALLPTITELAVFANDELVPILNEVIDEIGPVLGDAIRETAPAFLDLVREVAPLVPSLVELGISALPGIITSVELLLPLLIDWTKNTSTVFDMVDLFFGLLSGDTSIAEIIEWVERAEGSFADLARGFFGFAETSGAAFGSFLSSVRTTLGDAVGVVASLPGRALSALGDIGSKLFGAGRAIIQGFIDGIRSMLGSIGNALGGVMDFIRGFFPSSPAERGPFSGSGWTDLAKSGGAVLDQFRSGMAGGVEITATVGGAPLGSAPAFAGASRFDGYGPAVVIERVVLDASSVREISDIVDMVKALPQVSRAMTMRAG